MGEPPPKRARIADDAQTDTADEPSSAPLSRTSSGVSLEMDNDILSGFSLLDLIVLIEAHTDLWLRKTRPKVEQIRAEVSKRATLLRNQSFQRDAPSRSGSGSGELRHRSIKVPDRIEQEILRFRRKVDARLDKFSERWHDSKVVSMRERWSYTVGVLNVLLSALVAGFRPHWIPWVYTLQCAYMLPLRSYTYKKSQLHYFLADFCCYLNVLLLLYIHVFPGSTTLWLAVYALSHGPLATAIATWRNSLVFHEVDKVISTFIHVYPPFVCMALRHLIPDAEIKYPALAKLPSLHFKPTIIICSVIYLTWQLLYWRFILVERRAKIAAGRVTSFTYLREHNKGWVGKTIRKTPERHREWLFIFCQYVYTLVTIMPSFLLYRHPLLNGIWLVLFFGVATYNGGTFYLEVFGRRFEKEIKRLKSELEALEQELLARDTAASSSMSRTGSESGSPVKPFRTVSGGTMEPLDLDEDKSTSEATIPLVDGSPALDPTRSQSSSSDVPRMALSGDAVSA